MSNFEEWDIDTLRVRYKELEEEVESQDKTIDKLVEEQEEREKYTHSLEEENNYLKQKSIRQLERYTKYHNTQIENFNNMLDDCIPISVIQNKIDEYKKEVNDVPFNMIIKNQYFTKIQVLEQLLLEESK